MDSVTLRTHYGTIKAEATALAGGLLDIPRRVLVLDDLYRDSGGNHVFSLIAAHGALWAYGYFEVGGSIGRVIANRYFYNPTEKAFRLGLLQEFAEGFRRVNRQVCIDTYTNYHFTRQHGRQSAASDILPAGLLEALNRVHAARQAGKQLSAPEMRLVFEQSFHCEQEVTVAPGVQTAVAGFDCPFMKFFCLRPLVRFAYFPRCNYLFFCNFADKAERIAKGMRAYDHAAQAGWEHVRRTMRAYDHLPARFFEAPAECMAAVRASLEGPAEPCSSLRSVP